MLMTLLLEEHDDDGVVAEDRAAVADTGSDTGSAQGMELSTLS